MEQNTYSEHSECVIEGSITGRYVERNLITSQITLEERTVA